MPAVRPTRIVDLLLVFGACAAGSWMLVRAFYGSLPHIPPYAGASLYIVAAALVGLALLVRSRVGSRRIGPGPSELHPLTAARALILAKASALLGAGAAGIWLGMLLIILPERARLTAAAADTTGVVLGAIAGIVLVAAALFLEYCCRRPDDPPEEPDT